jgi:hypothetical protein
MNMNTFLIMLAGAFLFVVFYLLYKKIPWKDVLERFSNLFFWSLVFMGLFLFAGQSFAGEVNTFTWVPPTTNADGTPLDDLDGYTFYCGISSGAYGIQVNIGNVNSVLIGDIITSADDMYYCSVTAYDVWGNESDYSNEVRVQKRAGFFFGPDGVPPGAIGTLRTTKN